MANRDKSQKAAFVYTNIYEIYKKAQAAEVAPLTSDSRVIRADQIADLNISKFNPPKLARPESALQQAQNAALPAGANPFDDLKANINRLRDLHSRLRFMLKELEDLVEKK